jgi:rhamnosyltransferase subunit B
MDTKKNRIVIATWGSFGDLHPFMAIALELNARGHQAVIATSEIYREKIEAAGLKFFAVRPDAPSPDSPEAVEMLRRVTHSRKGPKYVWSELLMRHIRDSYEDTLAAVKAEAGADLLLSHTVASSAPLVAEKTGIRWISAVLQPIVFCSAYDPPTPPQFPAARHIAAIHPFIGRIALGLGKRTTLAWSKPLQELRRELNLPPGGNPIFEGQHSPQRVLGLYSKVLGEIQPDFPPNTILTGFPFYDRKDEQEIAPDLLRFLEAGEPPLLFTLGSSATLVADDFFRVSIEAAQKLNRRALLLIGDERNLPQTKLPSTIACFDYAPHSLVMPRSAVNVHQGGIGTMGQALRAGRPMLVVPYGQDQPDNARRSAALGVARTIPRSRYTLANVVRELNELLTNEEYRVRAAKAGEQVRAEDGARTACDAIEEMML